MSVPGLSVILDMFLLTTSHFTHTSVDVCHFYRDMNFLTVYHVTGRAFPNTRIQNSHVSKESLDSFLPMLTTIKIHSHSGPDAVVPSPNERHSLAIFHTRAQTLWCRHPMDVTALRYPTNSLRSSSSSSSSSSICSCNSSCLT